MAQTFNSSPDAAKVFGQVVPALIQNDATLQSSFSGASAPANPVAGQLWFDTTNAAGSRVLKIYNGSSWVNVASSL